MEQKQKPNTYLDNSNSDQETQGSTLTFYGPQNEPIDFTKSTEFSNTGLENSAELLGSDLQELCEKFNKTNMISNQNFNLLNHDQETNQVLVGQLYILITPHTSLLVGIKFKIKKASEKNFASFFLKENL